MNRALSRVATSALVVGILAALAVQVSLLPAAARTAAMNNPEAAFLEVPGIVWGVLVDGVPRRQ